MKKFKRRSKIIGLEFKESNCKYLHQCNRSQIQRFIDVMMSFNFPIITSSKILIRVEPQTASKTKIPNSKAKIPTAETSKALNQSNQKKNIKKFSNPQKMFDKLDI